MERVHLVIVEPSEVNQLQLLASSRPGLEVAAHATTARDALSAIQAISTLRRIATVVSLDLPGPRDSFWLIRSIRERFPSVHILAFDTKADEATISQAFFAGADGYVDSAAGEAWFVRAIQQVAEGELALADSSSPEPEPLEEPIEPSPRRRLARSARAEPPESTARLKEEDEEALSAEPAISETSRRRLGVQWGRRMPPASSWLVPDPRSTVWLTRSPDRNVRRLATEDYARLFLEPKLERWVPEDVRGHFALAQRTLLYGIFYYPFYSLGEELIFRAADAAVRRRCGDLGGPAGRLASMVKWLASQGDIPEDESRWWLRLRASRSGANPTSSARGGAPRAALRSMRQLAERINQLFGSTH